MTLGVYLRGAGRCPGAPNQFRQTLKDAKIRHEAEVVELARSAAVWKALRLKKTQEAEELIHPGRTPGGKPRFPGRLYSIPIRLLVSAAPDRLEHS